MISILNQAASQTHDEPSAIDISDDLKREMPQIYAMLKELKGDLSSIKFQSRLKSELMGVPVWANWIEQVRSPIGLRPFLVKAGLGIERDDDVSRKILVGLALNFEPEHFVPPYSIGNQAVTEVLAKTGSTALSHSENDLPAPPHTAGFFEKQPPATCYFSCIRPHPGGGAETTVVNLEAILNQAPQALIDEWSNKTYYLKTSRRLGSEILPFKLLSWVNGIPCLRYRKECMVGFDGDRSIMLLDELLNNPANHYIVPLKPGETLIHSNGAPHSRLMQLGDTPLDESLRRKLIRCRTES